MKAFLLDKLISFVLPAIAVPVAYALAQFIKRGWGWLDRQGAFIKRVAVFLISAGIVVVTELLRIPTPAECTPEVTEACIAAITAPGFLKALVVACGAAFLHYLKKQNPRA